MGLLKPRRGFRTRHAAGFGRLQILDATLVLDVIDALLDRRMLACLGRLCDSGRYMININLSTDCKK